MPFTYPTVLVGSQPYYVYGDLTDANLYLNAAISSQATAWLAATDTVKARALVSAARWLDAGGNWSGDKTDAANALAFPRTGLVDASGQAVDSATLPDVLVSASFELAAALVDNPDLRDELQNPSVKELHAGSVGMTFNRPLGGSAGAKDIQITTPFPTNVMDMIGLWLQGNFSSAGAVVEGVDQEGYDVDFGLQHGI